MQLNKQILAEIRRQIASKSFHKTELYKLLRDELLGIGNWKAKPRGKPNISNFRGSPEKYDHPAAPAAWIAQHNKEFR